MLLFIVSCGSSEKGSDIEQTKSQMDSVATTAQKTLLKNISDAIQKGGTEYAVSFCNIMAIPITDSLSEKYNLSISRITDQTRNPLNGLKTENDQAVFEVFKTHPKLMDSLISEDKKMVYYKRINTAMPTCIKCHGNPKTDIEPKTLTKIKSLYPDDHATGYVLNDFRGLWRIEENN